MKTQAGIRINKAVVRKILHTVDQGLCAGLGDPIPGQMCVEAAVCYGLGLPHGDDPACVGAAVRAFKIGLNDAEWSSRAARAAGMRRLAIAQLGSDGLDQTKFAEALAIATVKKIVPIGSRTAAARLPEHAVALESAAAACEKVASLSAAAFAARSAAESAESAESAASVQAAAWSAARSAESAEAAEGAARSVAAAWAAEAAVESAAAAEGAAWSAARSACTAEAAARSARSVAAAWSAARSARSAAASGWSAAGSAESAEAAARDKVLAAAADMALEVLVEMGSPGCKYLPLADIAT